MAPENRKISFGEKTNDPENGNINAENRRLSVYPDNDDELDEYTRLQKYISTYRDPKAASEDPEDSAADARDAGKGRPWWAFWRTGGSKNAAGKDDGVVPTEWLDADIQHGISNQDVETRRRKFGWNEITTEKENLFLKFLGFFTGPILYGKHLDWKTLQYKDTNP